MLINHRVNKPSSGGKSSCGVIQPRQVIFNHKQNGVSQLWCVWSGLHPSLHLLLYIHWFFRDDVKWYKTFSSQNYFLQTRHQIRQVCPLNKTSLYFSLPTSLQLHNFTRKWAIREKIINISKRYFRQREWLNVLLNDQSSQQALQPPVSVPIAASRSHNI